MNLFSWLGEQGQIGVIQIPNLLWAKETGICGETWSIKNSYDSNIDNEDSWRSVTNASIRNYVIFYFKKVNIYFGNNKMEEYVTQNIYVEILLIYVLKICIWILPEPKQHRLRNFGIYLRYSA